MWLWSASLTGSLFRNPEVQRIALLEGKLSYKFLSSWGMTMERRLPHYQQLKSNRFWIFKTKSKIDGFMSSESNQIRCEHLPFRSKTTKRVQITTRWQDIVVSSFCRFEMRICQGSVVFWSKGRNNSNKKQQTGHWSECSVAYPWTTYFS